MRQRLYEHEFRTAPSSYGGQAFWSRMRRTLTYVPAYKILILAFCLLASANAGVDSFAADHAEENKNPAAHWTPGLEVTPLIAEPLFEGIDGGEDRQSIPMQLPSSRWLTLQLPLNAVVQEKPRQLAERQAEFTGLKLQSRPIQSPAQTETSLTGHTLPGPHTEADEEERVESGWRMSQLLAGKAKQGVATAAAAAVTRKVPIPSAHAVGTANKRDKPTGVAALAGNTEKSYIIELHPGELDMLAKVIYAEARGEDYEGQVAVAAVVINRVQASGFPKTVREVIHAKGAFTAVRDGQYGLKPDNQAYKAAQEALRGKDPTGDAVYYYNPKIATSKWIRTRTLTARIGNHWFAR